MPTYEYACEACSHAFEKEQRITEDPIRKCPKCGKQKVKRLIGGGGTFILKGGGWYADLYSSKAKSGADATADAGEAPPAEKESPPSPEKGSGDAGSGDAESSATKESKGSADAPATKGEKEKKPAAKKKAGKKKAS